MVPGWSYSGPYMIQFMINLFPSMAHVICYDQDNFFEHCGLAKERLNHQMVQSIVSMEPLIEN